MRIQSDAQYAHERAAKSVSDEAKWRREAEVWFDGSVQSVDGRLAMCRRLLVGARTKAASEGISEARLDRIAYYEQSQVALEHLRRQLLTGCVDITSAESSGYRNASLQAPDRRWVALEAAKLAREHRDVPADELAIRAANYAESCTGVLPPKRARAITAALVAETLAIQKSIPRQKQASVVPVTPECPPEMMFI